MSKKGDGSGQVEYFSALPVYRGELTGWDGEPVIRVEGTKKIGSVLILPCGYDQGALSGGHELADCTLGELAAGFGEVELERGVGEGDLDQRV
jgi:hypothetical protein